MYTLTHLPHICVSGSSLVQVMACRLHGAKPLPGPVLNYCKLDNWKRLQKKFESKNKIFIHENVFEAVVCEMAAILSRV